MATELTDVLSLVTKIHKMSVSVKLGLVCVCVCVCVRA